MNLMSFWASGSRKENRPLKEKKVRDILILVWAEALRRLLAHWLELWQGSEKPAGHLIWKITIETWQTAVHETLAAQNRWLLELNERLHVTSGSPTDLRKNVQQALVVLLGWTEVQQQLWEGWFNLFQRFEPLLENGQPLDETLQSNLQLSGEALICKQEELIRHWLEDRSTVSREEKIAGERDDLPENVVY